MDERHAAESQIAQSRERLGDLAEELSRRVSPTYVRERAKEKVMVKSIELKNRAVSSPWPYQLLGALLGWAMGSTAFKARDKWVERRDLRGGGYYGNEWESLREPSRVEAGASVGYGIGTPDAAGYDVGSSYDSAIGYTPAAGSESGFDASSDSSGGIGDKLSEKKDAIKEKAAGAIESVKQRAGDAMGTMRERTGGMKGRASEMLHSARERIPSSGEARMRMSGAYHHTVDDRPVYALIGAVAVGALAAWLMPVSDKERRMLSPAKEKMKVQVKDQISKAQGIVEEKVGAIGAIIGNKSESKQEGENSGQSWNAGSEQSSDYESSNASSSELAGPNLPSVH